VLKREKINLTVNYLEFSESCNPVWPCSHVVAADHPFFDPFQIEDRLFQQSRISERIAAAKNPTTKIAVHTPADHQNADNPPDCSGFCPADLP
jgi:hypothetical protein